ncbi:MAG: hypothetical protein EON93_02625 [Burkholderiales bacterium]|nr:MAG: hypothetical protein EON93_02625 [Burkholderiales bacterium]
MPVSVVPRAGLVMAVLGGLSLAAVLAGIVVCQLSGIPAAVWLRNLAAWVIGGIAAYFLSRGGSWVFPAALGLAALLTASSFLGPEQMGVHRWISAGPVSLNVAMMTLPAALASLAWLGRTRVWPWFVALAIIGVLAMQPDRSQAAAFGVGVIWLVLRGDQKVLTRVAVTAVAALAIAAAWMQPDPLMPVPEVEEILLLAYAVAPALAVVAFASLLLFSVAPGVLMRKGATVGRRAGEVLSVYFLISAAMPFVGAYPVPLVGIGMSPIIGAWLATGVLACLIAAEKTAGGGAR